MVLDRGSPPVGHCIVLVLVPRTAQRTPAALREMSILISPFSCQHSNKPDINLWVAKNPKSRLYFVKFVRAYRVKVNLPRGALNFRIRTENLDGHPYPEERH